MVCRVCIDVVEIAAACLILRRPMLPGRFTVFSERRAMAKRTPADPQTQPKSRRSRSTPDAQPAQASETMTPPVPSEAGDDAPLEAMAEGSQGMGSESMA